MLINDARRAVLCDFGLAVAADEVSVPTGLTTSGGLKASWRWCSPEVVTEDTPRTMASDIWAWGCLLVEVRLTHAHPCLDKPSSFHNRTCIQIMRGIMPYELQKSERSVIAAICRGQLPALPSRLSGSVDLSSITMLCWETDPAIRATAQTCLNELGSLSQVGPSHIT